ncbi:MULTISPECIES: hypothetical protein [unclassified Paenibacillus]|uniref:hypothetical protein n=1 Tax=unclassified Paenibacillus TaxID=185978 RepID=UPI001AE4EE62|nr:MULTISPECIES: hypothetical protein [unclassified Paenibacillus]MBP1155751.1 hypothetical protein [Paenibacillus sp. PvP091]MBP1168863.1 hypothetical protein [Paenibacillus sp. PvR098]MBP2439891.1 hypothetical protein [Paenibacillus sp. PvP052]
MAKQIVRNMKSVRAAKPVQAAQLSNITGVWNCSDGGRYYIRQIGRRIFWAGLSGRGNGAVFTNVYRATRTGDVISGQWADVPRGVTLNSGTLTVEVFINNNGVLSLRQLAQTGGFGGQRWTFIRARGLSVTKRK